MIADKHWNQNDELRALASLITQISADIRIRNIIIALHSRMSLWNIVEKNHSEEVKGFHITSVISPLHSSTFIAAWANSPVSIISQKI